MNSSSLIALFMAFVNQLKFRNLFLIVITLFFIDLFVPDFIPFFDEIILGLLAIFLANWKKARRRNEEGNLIEGEIIDDNEQDK